MSDTIEDRLTSALAARAEQVQPEQLRPLDPSVRRARPAYQPWLAGVAAAVCAAVIATPFLLRGQGASPDGPAGPATAPPAGSASAKPTLRAPALVGKGELLSVEQQADVDGDRAADRVLVWWRDGRQGIAEDGRIEVLLANSNSTSTDIFPMTSAPELLPATDLNGDGGQEILVRMANAGGDQLRVYWVHENLVDLAYAPEGEPPLAGGVARQSRQTGYWLDDQTLMSYREQEPDPAAQVYPVDVWSWEVVIDDGEPLLRATSGGVWCMGPGTSDLPTPCG